MSTSFNPAKPLTLTMLAALPALAQAIETPESRLRDIVVSAGGFEQELAAAPASITVVTRAELEKRQVTNLADALRGIEGVNVSPLDARDGKTGNQSISLRGLPREYTLILIDGVRQNPMGNITPNSFNDSQSVFIPPVAAIERIEVIRGPMSTLYGSDALGGVVNIITRKPGKAMGGSASISRTFQSDGEFGDKTLLEAYLSGPIASEAASFQLFGRRYDRASSDIRVPGVDHPRPVTADTPTMGQNPVAADALTVGGKLSLTPNTRQELFLGFNVARQEYDNGKEDIGALHRTGNPTGSACNTTPTPNFCRGYEQELNFDRDQITLGHVGRFDFGLLETRLTRDKLETRGRTIPLGSGLNPALEGSGRKLKLETDILDSKLVSGIGNHMFTVGGQYIDVTMADGLWGGAENDMRQWSLFVEDEWSMTDNLALTGGLRHDKNEAYSGHWTPRAHAVWRADQQWTFKGGVARGFRTPNLEQLTNGIIGYGSQGTVPLYGNPSLEPETSTNFEATALYQPGGGNSAQATVFRNKLKNLIEAGTGANAGQSLNIGEAVLQGLELASSLRLNDSLTLSGNYTYIDSEVTHTQLDTGNPAQLIASRKGDPLTSVPEHMLNATLKWQVTPRFSTFLNGEYRSSAFRPRNYHEPQNGGNGQGQVAPGVRDSRAVLGDFKGYSLFNLGADYRLNKLVTIKGVIYNLLDKDFKDYNAYTRCANAGCTGSGIQAYSNVYNGIFEPRRLWVSMSVDF